MLYMQDSKEAAVGDAVALQIVDLYSLKHYAIKLAADAARTVLQIDQVCNH